MAGVWYMIVPQLTEYTNLCTNPSFETNTTGWTAVAGGISTGTDFGYQTQGIQMLKVTTSTASADGVYYGSLALTAGTTYTWGFDFRGTASKEYLAYFADTSGNLVGSASTLTGTGAWTRNYVSLACATSDNYRIYVRKNNWFEAESFYLDGVSVIATTAELTYFDGDTENCRWTGAAHGSTSVCPATARNIGVVTDLQDYNLRVQVMDGVGMAQSTHHVSQYALMPGAEYKGHKVQPRSILLTNTIYGTNLANLHSKRKDIVDLFKHDLAPNDQPIIMRYTGANSSLPVEIKCYIDKELGVFDSPTIQKQAIRLACYAPYFYELYGKASILNSSSTVTHSYFTVKRNGTWADITASTADTPGTGVRVRDILIKGEYLFKSGFDTPGGSAPATNERVYISGYFLNWDGGANNDYIAFYDFSAGTWSTLQAGTNGYVRSMDIAPDGKIYACGEFTQIGSATADRIAVWSGASWDVMGTGFDGTAYDVLVGNDGKVYACGNDATIGGVANAAYVAYWDGSAWNAMGSGLSGAAYVLTKDTAGNIYIGGSQTGYVHKWNGTSLTSLACPNICWALKSTPGGKLYAGVYAATADYLYEYNGQAWSALGALGGGTGGAVTIYSIDIDADGNVWVGGDFTTAGDLTVQGLVVWNGYSFVHPGIVLPASSVVWKVLCNGNDVYIGYDQTGTNYRENTTTINNTGTARAYPVIAIKRAGGTSARLMTLGNETTGARLYFDYALQDGETVYIDFREGRRGITSSYYGNLWRAILRGSDFADFYLLPGNNTIDLFVYPAGSPTITATYRYEPRHESIDGSAA